MKEASVPVLQSQTTHHVQRVDLSNHSNFLQAVDREQKLQTRIFAARD